MGTGAGGGTGVRGVDVGEEVSEDCDVLWRFSSLSGLDSHSLRRDARCTAWCLLGSKSNILEKRGEVQVI